MAQKIRVAVIGVGFFGERHVKTYAAHPNVQLVAVVDTNIERAQEIATRYSDTSGTACAVYKDVSSLFGKIDAASIVTPTHSHAPTALSLLDAGIHILIEKPMTANVEEADAIMALAQKKGKIVKVGHIERYNPALLQLRAYNPRPRLITCQRMGPFLERAANVSVVFDLMIHDIDIVLSLAQAPLTSVDAVGLSVVSSNIDLAHARLSFADGLEATIMASRIAEAPFRTLHLFENQRYFVLNYLTRELTVFSPSEGSRKEKHAFEQGDALKTEIEAFVDAVTLSSTSHSPFCSDDSERTSSAREAVSVALQIMERIKKRAFC